MLPVDPDHHPLQVLHESIFGPDKLHSGQKPQNIRHFPIHLRSFFIGGVACSF